MTQPAVARPIDQLFAEYGRHHRNPINEAIHFAAVPMIVWSALALISRIPFPDALKIAPQMTWAWIVVACALLYYFTLSAPLALVMAVLAVAFLALIELYPANAFLPLSAFAFLMFALSWVLQIVGHRIEGEKPAFLRDAKLLLIAPLWLTSEIFRALGLRY